MNFNFLKIKKNNAPSLKKMRPHMFDMKTLWFSSLIVCLFIILVTSFIDFKLVYSQYFNDDKSLDSEQNIEKIMNIDLLKKAVDKRNNFINTEKTLPRDPSI